jgi:transcriptional regulator with XRE-family HTH domain
VETTTELLDKAKEMCGLTSDYALAKRLRVSKQAVSGWRNGRNLPDIVTCEKIAEITGIPLARVLGIVGEARAISTAEKAVWRKLASAAALLLSVGVLGAFAANQDAQARPGSISHNYDRMHIMLFRLRGLARTLRASIERLTASKPACRWLIWT